MPENSGRPASGRIPCRKLDASPGICPGWGVCGERSPEAITFRR